MQGSAFLAFVTQHHAHTGDVMVGNITFFMIFAVFDRWLLTQWINCSFDHLFNHAVSK